MCISLEIMTKDQNRTFFRDFANDPLMFMDSQPFTEFVYSAQRADSIWERHRNLDRVHLAIMLDGKPIGEIILKNIDASAGSCTMGIHLQNDQVKNKGYGTNAEILALEYAFTEMKMNKVFADALIKNLRSNHVLEKVGFERIGMDESFIYYQCSKEHWKRPGGI